jgi:hypothetical protein
VTSVDIGVDAARVVAHQGAGRVRAVFSRALYLDVPGGLMVLGSTEVPRGPLHLRVRTLPAVTAGCPVLVSTGLLAIDGQVYPSTAPVWSPRLPPASALGRVNRAACRGRPTAGLRLALGPGSETGISHGALTALRSGDLLTFADLVGGRGAGLTPVGDDVLAGVLLVANALAPPRERIPEYFGRVANRAPTSEIAHAFLACAARGRSIEPAHRLLDGLATADSAAVYSAVDELRSFGSSSGAALAYGIWSALMELPRQDAS